VVLSNPIRCKFMEKMSVSKEDRETRPKYRVRINYRRILQNHIFTNTEQKYMMLLPFEKGMSAVS